MTKLGVGLVVLVLAAPGGCAYPTQQMVEVTPATALAAAAQPTADPVCDDPLERTESADVVGLVTEDAICALTARMVDAGATR